MKVAVVGSGAAGLGALWVSLIVHVWIELKMMKIGSQLRPKKLEVRMICPVASFLGLDVFEFFDGRLN